MSFFVFLLILLLIPVILVFLFINGILFRLKRAVRPNQQQNPHVRHHRHNYEKPIDEVVEDEIEYSDEDVIEAEFEDIQEENSKEKSSD